jgi:murein DD-endopeptidase MepM/ murein hydrolase activator NlpD
MLRRWLLLLCALASVPLTAQTRRPKKSPTELKRRLGGVQQKIRATRREIRHTRARERRIGEDIREVEVRLTGTVHRLEQAETRLAKLKRDHVRLTERIARTEERLAVRRRLLGRRLRENYQRGTATYAQVLLQSRSYSDYLSRSVYVQRIVESDVDLIRGIRNDITLLSADRHTLESTINEQDRLKQELAALKESYREDRSRKRELLSEVRQTREQLEEMLDELERSSNEIEAQIRALQQTPKGRARMARPWSGSFQQPADGPVTSGFGMRHHPILKRSRMHTGLDIGASYGSIIRAAAAGEVILAAYKGGYGNTVVIDHGGGVTTLYGHCSALLVHPGQVVTGGQPIARVGSTGLSTGPHLHWEVRRNGTPVDPR